MTDVHGHPLDRALDLTELGDNRYRGELGPDYANFIGPFGGVLAASLLRAICLHPQRLGDPLAVTVNFGGPVGPEPFEIAVSITRTNRSSQHWHMELRQGDGVPLTGSAVFALRRDTWSDQENGMPDVPPPEAVDAMSFSGVPPWVANYDIRVITGQMSFVAQPPREQDSSATTLWVRDQPPRPLDFQALLALSDVFFPRVFVRRPMMVPIGTISLTTYFHASGEELLQQGEDYLLGSARGNRFHDGYFDQSGELWARDGTLLATTHQVVYFKE